VDRAWLSLTIEEPLEPDLEICDPHHHLWVEPTGKWPRYDLVDLRVDTNRGHRVTETVFIDCASNYRRDGPEHLRPLGETEYVAERADESERTPGARIAAIVSFADLTRGEAVEDVLHAHIEAGHGRFRGIRHAAGWDAHPDVPNSHTAPPPGLYSQARFGAALRVLARMGLSFEAWQYHPQLTDVVQLAQNHPELSIVLNHLGGPLGIGPYAARRSEVLAAWRPPMQRLAHLPNVALKVGGIGMSRYGLGWEKLDKPPTSDDVVAAWGDELRWCIDQFGPDRCMFESNFPVDGESFSYVVLWNVFKKVSRGYSPAERDALFRQTARRLYRISA
jgi:predicted TIM-barrel fold metal-dependent hydrolase